MHDAACCMSEDVETVFPGGAFDPSRIHCRIENLIPKVVRIKRVSIRPAKDKVLPPGELRPIPMRKQHVHERLWKMQLPHAGRRLRDVEFAAPQAFCDRQLPGGKVYALPAKSQSFTNTQALHC